MSVSEVATCINIVNSLKVNELTLILQVFESQNRISRKPELQNRCKQLLNDPSTSNRACLRVREVSRTGSFRPTYQTPSYPMSAFRTQAQPTFQYQNSSRLNSNQHFNGNGYTAPPVTSSVVTLPSKIGGRAESMMISRLPFYDVLGTVLRLSELQCMPNRVGDVRVCFSFSIPDAYSPHLSYRTDKQPPRYEVQMRMFQLDTDVEQVDDFPPKLTIHVNDHAVTPPALIPTNKPNAEMKRLSRPIDITSFIATSGSTIRTSKLEIEWYSDRRVWAVGVWIVNRQNTQVLHERLLKSGARRSIDETKRKIMQMLSGDDDNIALDQVKVSLICSLMRTRQEFPGRAKGCLHIQTFDVKNYLMMNEKRPSWKCPQCGTNAHYDNLVIDDYFMDVLRKTKSEVREVELLGDGSWKVSAVSEDEDSDADAPVVKHEVNEIKTSSSNDDSVIILDSSDDDVAPSKKTSAQPAPSKTTAKKQRRHSSVSSTSTSSSSSSSDGSSSQRRRKVPQRSESSRPAQRPVVSHEVITLSDSDEEPIPAVVPAVPNQPETYRESSRSDSISSSSRSHSHSPEVDVPVVPEVRPVPMQRPEGSTSNGVRLNGTRPGLNGIRREFQQQQNELNRRLIPRGNFHERLRRETMLAVTDSLTDFLHSVFITEIDGAGPFNAS